MKFVIVACAVLCISICQAFPFIDVEKNTAKQTAIETDVLLPIEVSSVHDVESTVKTNVNNEAVWDNEAESSNEEEPSNEEESSNEDESRKELKRFLIFIYCSFGGYCKDSIVKE